MTDAKKKARFSEIPRNGRRGRGKDNHRVRRYESYTVVISGWVQSYLPQPFLFNCFLGSIFVLSECPQFCICTVFLQESFLFGTVLNEYLSCVFSYDLRIRRSHFHGTRASITMVTGRMTDQYIGRFLLFLMIYFHRSPRIVSEFDQFLSHRCKITHINPSNLPTDSLAESSCSNSSLESLPCSLCLQYTILS